MKIECRCGALIVDQTDALPHKAHLVPDQEWEALLDALDAAIGRAARDGESRSAASRAVREALTRASRPAWQCRRCGRLYLDDAHHQAHEFAPASADVPREILRARHG